MNRHRMNRRVRHVGNVLWRNTVIDDDILVAVEMVDHRRVMENPVNVTSENTMTPRMRIAKIPCRHECERRRAQPETESDTNVRTVENKSHSGTICAIRRQWRPAAIIIRVTPANP